MFIEDTHSYVYIFPRLFYSSDSLRYYSLREGLSVFESIEVATPNQFLYFSVSTGEKVLDPLETLIT